MAVTRVAPAQVDELFPFVKRDIKATLAVMDGFPVTIRTLDPPLHEFVPQGKDEREKLAKAVGITVELGIKLGRTTRPKLKVGICGEHGGEPSSVELCHLVGMD